MKLSTINQIVEAILDEGEEPEIIGSMRENKDLLKEVK